MSVYVENSISKNRSNVRILTSTATYIKKKLDCKMYNFIYVIAWIPMYRVLRLGVHVTVTIRFALFGPTRGGTIL